MKYKLDWSTFTRRIFINCSAKKVFDLWTSGYGLEEWFLEKAEFTREGLILASKDRIRQGDHYSWKWYQWDMYSKGEIINIVKGSLLEFEFGKAGNVKVEFLDVSINECQVILTQYNIPTDEESIRNYYYGCTNGWSFWMINCKLYMEHGITINHKSNPLVEDVKGELVNA